MPAPHDSLGSSSAQAAFPAGWSVAAQAMYRAAQAVSQPGGPTLFAELMTELGNILGAAATFVAVFTDASRTELRSLAARLDGEPMPDFLYPIEGSPCAQVVGRAFRHVASGVAAEFPQGSIFAVRGMDSYAAFPLADSEGTPLGLLVAMDREPVADATLAEALLKIFAGRIAAEIEQLRASEALQRSEASYRAIFESAEDAIFIHDWDSGRILDANPKACLTYGYTHDEIRKVSVDDISSGVAPYTGAHALRYIELARLDRCPPFDWHRRSKDGSLHWDEVRLKPVRIGGRQHILAFTREVTERKAALAALQAREEQYRVIFDGSADAMVLWDQALCIADVNDAFSRLTGYGRDEVIGMPYGSHLDADDEPRRLDLIRGALAGREGQIETRAVHKDGRVFDIELRYLPVNFGGDPYALAVGRDITDRLERERELQRSAARLRATVEAAFDCVIGMDGEGRIVEFNAAAERCFGHRREAVLGRLLADVLLPPRHRTAHADGLRHFHRTGQGRMVGRRVETTALRADGTEIPVELAISVAAVPEGNIFVGYLRDISARLDAEAERGALEAQLRQAQKMEAIGQLTGGIAHDFNNILTSVIGYLVLGQERAESLHDPALIRQLGQAHLAAQRARELIARMLTFARRQRGERRVIALTPLVTQTLQLLRATLPASLAVDAAPLHIANGSADDAGPQVAADPVQLEQVLFNLCINARDAMGECGLMRVRIQERGGGWRCASCRQQVDAGHWIELSVADDGTGIAPEVLERMFDPFYSTKDVGLGSGMGLAMVHGIVHDHGGHVAVDTRPGEGSVFRVMLPYVPGASPDADATSDEAADHAETGTPASHLVGRVMLIEDEPMVGDLMAERLGAWGLDVALFRDPLQACAWLDDPANAIDLLITDHTMPRMTGLALAQHAISARPSLPVILYTGNADQLDREHLARHGVRHALRKPVDASELRKLVQGCLTTPFSPQR